MPFLEMNFSEINIGMNISGMIPCNLKNKEQGNSLIEVLVALSLFSLMTFGAGLLFLGSKALEKHAHWQMVSQSYAFSILESGYYSKKYVLDYWQQELQKNFKEQTICLEEMIKEPVRTKRAKTRRENTRRENPQ